MRYLIYPLAQHSSAKLEQSLKKVCKDDNSQCLAALTFSELIRLKLQDRLIPNVLNKKGE